MEKGKYGEGRPNRYQNKYDPNAIRVNSITAEMSIYLCLVDYTNAQNATTRNANVNAAINMAEARRL